MVPAPGSRQDKDLPLVCAVILNTNKRDDTLDCLRSLAENDYQNLHVIVLDNASTDSSVEAIRTGFPQVEIIQLAENLGYAGNNNVGIQAALDRQADWVFILNEDTILSPECVSALVACGKTNPKIGVLGPLVFHADEPDVIQSAGGYLDAHWRPLHTGINETDRGQYAEVREVEWISGCGLLVRREALQQAGLIDPRFFYYNEETELCQRIKRLGWSLWMVPMAKMWHKGVQRNYHPSANVTYYKVRNFLLFLDLIQAPARIKALTWMENLRMVASYTLRPKWRHARDHRDAAVQGMRDYLMKRWGKRG